jgi:hypothetical protein
MARRIVTALVGLLLLGGSLSMLAAPVPEVGPVESASPRLHRLDPNRISPDQRFPWHPPQLVAVLGDGPSRHEAPVQALVVSPEDGQSVITAAGRYLYGWDTSLQRRSLLDAETWFLAVIGPDK